MPYLCGVVAFRKRLIYMVSARKEAFVADAKKELHPLFDQER